MLRREGDDEKFDHIGWAEVSAVRWAPASELRARLTAGDPTLVPRDATYIRDLFACVDKLCNTGPKL